MLGFEPCDGLASHKRGVELLLVASCYRNQDIKLQPGGPFGSYAEFTFTY